MGALSNYAGPEADYRPIMEKLKKPKRSLRRVWDRDSKKLLNAEDSEGPVQYMLVNEAKADYVWKIPYLMPASKEVGHIIRAPNRQECRAESSAYMMRVPIHYQPP